jgi:hypoxanthine phosphoribosyltransferase
MTITAEEARRVYAAAETLYDRQTVIAAIERMAQQITADMADLDPLVLAVMSGAMIPAGILLSYLDFPLEYDYLHASRYRGQTTGSNELHWKVKPRYSLAGRHLLIIDDILDEGATLAAILDYCREAGAASIRSAVLVKKLHDRNPGVEADYVGLEVADRYLFGFGMDYHEYWRNAPGIFAVRGL